MVVLPCLLSVRPCCLGVVVGGDIVVAVVWVVCVFVCGGLDGDDVVGFVVCVLLFVWLLVVLLLVLLFMCCCWLLLLLVLFC